MPKIVNPATLLVKDGQEPTVAKPDYLSGDATILSSTAQLVVPAQAKHDIGADVQASLTGHILDPHAAHQAAAIEVAPIPNLTATNVQYAIQELLGLVPPKQASIGDAKVYMASLTGIPDWGSLKSVNSHLANRGGTFTLPQYNTYPYYWVPTVPGNHTVTSTNNWFVPSSMPSLSTEYTNASATDYTAKWSLGGAEPSDTIFNVQDGTYTGGGQGKAFAGAFTRGGNTIQTYRVLKENLPAPVVVSGVVSPADRGTLALIHWPAGGKMADFLAQGLLDRVVAAINLGQGISGEGLCPVDGKPGGLFLLGTDSFGAADPYVWPGQASGQASLEEIYTGISRTAGAQTAQDTGGYNLFTVDSPYWNFDGRGGTAIAITSVVVVSPTLTTIGLASGHGHPGPFPTTGKIPSTISGNTSIPDGTYTVSQVPDATHLTLRTGLVAAPAIGGTCQRLAGCCALDYPSTEVPFPGQVRLGTVTLAGITPVGQGIPILGAPYRYGLIRGTTDTTADGNFFDYRLPYLDNYSDGATGLKYTPTVEKTRYLTKPPIADVPNGHLTQAGNYTNFTKDYYPFQIGRFRHRFEIATQDAGSYLLMHFTKEVYFEAFVRDGVWPMDNQLYSVNVVNGAELTAGTEGLDDTQGTIVKNLIDQAQDGSVAAHPFFALRGAVYVDTDTNAPNITLSQYTLNTPGAKDVTVVSGVSYFTATDNLGHPNVTISPEADVLSLFGSIAEHSYLTGMKDGLASTSRVLQMSPIVVSLGDFSGSNFTLVSAPTDTWKHFQRVEFDLEAISAGNSVGGAGPGVADTASVTGLEISFDGDAEADIPFFSEYARPHLLVRMPNSQDATGTVNPSSATMAPVGGKDLLFHSTMYPLMVGPAVHYGNFRLAGAVPQHCWTGLQTSTKDTQERFLDEVYRYRADWVGLGNPVVQGLLTGPGLAAAPAPIEVPVQAGLADAFGGVAWDQAAWVQNDLHTMSLSAVMTNELQVAGLRHNTPPLTEGCLMPKPQAGVLLYPHTNYTNNVRPSFVDDAITQFDYTGCAGTREYVRAFDCAFSGTFTPVAAENQPFVLLRINGLKLEDFQYAGGPSPGSANIAIMAKVPGMTTWMDCGRLDGDGPSKQDPIRDGAGCQVTDLNTFDALDSQLDYRYCQVKLNVGPAINLFKSAVNPALVGEVPLLIKVIMYDTGVFGIYQYNFNWDFGASSLNRDLRGIIGIEIVRP